MHIVFVFYVLNINTVMMCRKFYEHILPKLSWRLAVHTSFTKWVFVRNTLLKFHDKGVRSWYSVLKNCNWHLTRMAAIFDFVPVLTLSKNVNPMSLSIPGPNLVLCEESEPNSPFIALTPLTTYKYCQKPVVISSWQIPFVWRLCSMKITIKQFFQYNLIIILFAIPLLSIN